MMTMDQINLLLHTSPAAQLSAGIGATLVLASTVALVLKQTVAKGQPHQVIDNLNARINAWWVMVALIGLAFLLGRRGVIIMFALISLAALREYMNVANETDPAREGGYRFFVLLAFAVVLPAQYGLLWISWYGLYAIFIPVYAFLVMPIVAVLSDDTSRFLERTAKVQWGLMVCIFCISHVPALFMLDIPGYAQSPLLLITWLIIVVQGSDVLQYVWGKLTGRHKVAPELSPSKTWEGLVGGVASATALGASLYWITPFSPAQAALMAFLTCSMGFLGGLVMSAIKRDRGVKDWGTLIEGHGGMLDRMDSIIFAAPVYFHVIRYWWTP
jgi:phosphatidate cytidylyltransferase